VRSDSPDGYRNQCKDCRREYEKEWIRNPPVKIVIPEGYRKCGKCKKVKTIDNFNKVKGEIRSSCKECHNKENAEWFEKNPDYSKKYREQHYDELIENGRQYYKENKVNLAIKNKESLENNPSQKSAAKKRKHEWYEKNKDKVIEGKRRRRARVAGCEENYTATDRKITLGAFNYRCFNCGTKDNICVDHHRPLIKRNPLSFKNAVVLCKICNSTKGTIDPEIFYGSSRCAELDKKLAQIEEENLSKVTAPNNKEK